MSLAWLVYDLEVHFPTSPLPIPHTPLSPDLIVPSRNEWWHPEAHQCIPEILEQLQTFLEQASQYPPSYHDRTHSLLTICE